MSRPRRRLLLVALALALGGAALMAYALLAPDPISPASFHLLHAGMTRAEVEAVLGPPSFLVARGPASFFQDAAWGTLLEPPGVKHPGPRSYWCDGAIFIEVEFDDGDTAVGAALQREVNPPLSWWERLRTWLKDQAGLRL